jgi:hypothetical protein
MVELARRLRDLGQMPLYPPNVKGWDGGRAWINSSTLLGRANLMRSIATSSEVRFAGGSLEASLDAHGVKTLYEALDYLSELLLAVPIDADLRAQLLAAVNQGGQGGDQRLRQLLHLVGSLPEFQLA